MKFKFIALLSLFLFSCEDPTNTIPTNQTFTIDSDTNVVVKNEPITEKEDKVETTKNLPSEFVVSEEFFAYGTDMSISCGGEIQERTMNWSKTFEYFDSNNKLVASAKEKSFSYYTKINITDEFGNKIGSVEEEIIESMFSLGSIYSIKDASGKTVAKSNKVDFFCTDITINRYIPIITN